MSPVRLLIADDHDVLRRGVRVTLENHPDLKVVAEARDGREAVEKAAEFSPDVAILDYSMPRSDGLEAAQEIVRNQPNTKVLILTVHDSDVLIQEMRQAGVHGFLRKAYADRDLISAVRALITNKSFYPAEVPTNAHRVRKSDARRPRQRLTTRQKEVVRLLAEGIRIEKIAEILGISPKTVATHKHNVLLRTDCHSTAELVRYAIRNGIIEA